MKATVDFNIESPLPVIASGLPNETVTSSSASKIYKFEQKLPIPSYLFALASGDIDFAEVGPRSKVATGPGELAAAKWELEDDVERFIVTAEKILKDVPYAWGSYNVLVLPPSFPYGGMSSTTGLPHNTNKIRHGESSLYLCHAIGNLWRSREH